MNTTVFNVGQVVRLKSGGPNMTIAKMEDDVNNPNNKNAFAFCSWFVGKKLEQRTFPIEILERVAL